MKKLTVLLALLALAGMFFLPHDLDGAASLPPSLNAASPEASIVLLPALEEHVSTWAQIIPAAAPRAPPALVRRARTCTWDGGGADALASNAVNWDTDTAPVAGDSIVFPTTTKACTWDISLALAAFTVNSGYVQTITQNSGANFNFSGNATISGACTITCHASATWTCAAFSNTAGTFNQGGAFTSTTFGLTSTGVYVGSSATMSTTSVTFSNTANLTATSNTWTLAGSFTKSNSPTFSANGGTIAITAASTFNAASLTFNLITINTTNANVTISASTTAPLGSNPTIAMGSGVLTVTGTISWSGLLTISNTGAITVTGTLTGTGSPTMDIAGGITTSSATITNAIGTVTFSGNSTNGSYTDTGDKLSASTIVINKGSAVGMTIAASTICRLGSNPSSASSLTAGGLQIVGTVTFSGTWTANNGFNVNAGGTLTGSSTPVINIVGSITVSATGTITNTLPTITWTGTGAVTLTDTGDKLSGTTFAANRTSGSITIAASTIGRFGASPTLTCGSITVTGTLRCTGTLTWTTTTAATTFTVGAAGVIDGAPSAFSISGSLTLTAGATWITAAPITATGGTSSCTVTDTTGLSTGTWTVNKSGASFTVAASTTVRLGAAPTTTVASAGLFTNSGTVTWSGTWAHTGGSFVSTGTLTGTSTPILTITEGSADFTSATLTNTFDLTMIQSSSTSRTFTGGGKTFGAFRRVTSGGSGSGTLVIASSNTFSTFRDNDATVAHQLTFTAGTTQTITGGSPGGVQYMIDGGTGSAIVTLASSSASSTYTLTFTTVLKPINFRNCAISDLTGSGAEIWGGPGSTYGTGNGGTFRAAINPRLRKQ